MYSCVIRGQHRSKKPCLLLIVQWSLRGQVFRALRVYHLVERTVGHLCRMQSRSISYRIHPAEPKESCGRSATSHPGHFESMCESAAAARNAARAPGRSRDAGRTSSGDARGGGNDRRERFTTEAQRRGDWAFLSSACLRVSGASVLKSWRFCPSRMRWACQQLSFSRRGLRPRRRSVRTSGARRTRRSCGTRRTRCRTGAAGRGS